VEQEARQSTAAAYVPLSFAPGKAYQFDWSHEVVLLNGVTVMVKAADLQLCHNRMLFVRCYPGETQEMMFDAHDPWRSPVQGTWTRHLRQYEDCGGNDLRRQRASLQSLLHADV
jgi:hypothetical protein